MLVCHITFFVAIPSKRGNKKLTDFVFFFCFYLSGPGGDSRISSLALEAAWAAKFAGLSEHEALGLVSTNIEEILGLEKSKDIVVWEGSPLNFGTPVLAFQHDSRRNGDRLEVASCWPNEADQ